MDKILCPMYHKCHENLGVTEEMLPCKDRDFIHCHFFQALIYEKMIQEKIIGRDRHNKYPWNWGKAMRLRYYEYVYSRCFKEDVFD